MNPLDPLDPNFTGWQCEKLNCDLMTSVHFLSSLRPSLTCLISDFSFLCSISLTHSFYSASSCLPLGLLFQPLTWSPGLHSLPQLWTSEKCPHYSRIARVQHTLPLGLMGFLRLAQTTLPREKGAHSTVNPGPMLRCLLFEQSQTFHNWFLYILPTVGFLTCHFQGE